MSKEATYTAEFHSGYWATLNVSLKGVRCEWTPDLPRNLPAADPDALVESYRIWRDGCLGEFAAANGLTIHTIHQDGVDCIAFRRREVTP